MSQLMRSRLSAIERSRGDMLTEAIISMLLIAIAGMGISYVTSKVSVSQRNFKVQQQVINELRSRVQNLDDISVQCAGTNAQTSNFSIDVKNVNNCDTTTATINGVTISDVYAPVVLTAKIDGLGSVRVGGGVDD